MSIKNRVDAASLPKIQLSWLQSKVEGAVNAYLSRLVADYPNEVLSVTLYGSQARGEAKNDSEIRDSMTVITVLYAARLRGQ